MRRLLFLCAFLFLLGNLLFLGGCDYGRPKGVLSKNKMAQVLADYHLTYSIAQNLPSDKRYQIPLLIKGTLRKHKVTEAQFDSSLIWYTRNPRDLNTIYSHVNRILMEREAALAQETEEQKASDGTSAEGKEEEGRRPFGKGDSVDVWQHDRFYAMNRLSSTRRVEFVLSPDSTFRSTDRLEWEFETRFLPEDNGKGGKAIAFLLARYRPDSIMIRTQIIRKDGRYSFALQNKSARAIQQLWGFVQYYPGDDETANGVNQLFIDRIRLMRYRKK